MFSCAVGDETSIDEPPEKKQERLSVEANRPLVRYNMMQWIKERMGSYPMMRCDWPHPYYEHMDRHTRNITFLQTTTLARGDYETDF